MPRNEPKCSIFGPKDSGTGVPDWAPNVAVATIILSAGYAGAGVLLLSAKRDTRGRGPNKEDGWRSGFAIAAVILVLISVFVSLLVLRQHLLLWFILWLIVSHVVPVDVVSPLTR